MPDQVTLRDGWGNLAVTLSVKGIVIDGDKIWLRKNERNTWELPGGRLDEGEQPEQTLEREIWEELGVKIRDPRIVDIYVWKKDFGSTTHVGIVTFVCHVTSKEYTFELQGEGGQASFKQFTIEEALELDDLPEVYKRALRKL